MSRAFSLRPITLKAARSFVEAHHRHNAPPRGHKFSISAVEGPAVAGVVIVGRPVARGLDDGVTAEVLRMCTPGDGGVVIDSSGRQHASPVCSMLYGAAVRACQAMGYQRVVTYTQGDEAGRSLKAAGFRKQRELPARKSWADSSVKLRAIRDPVGNGGVPRSFWVHGAAL
jgi:hypothetical protein